MPSIRATRSLDDFNRLHQNGEDGTNSSGVWCEEEEEDAGSPVEQEEEDTEPLERDEEFPNLVWTGPGRRVPLMLFTADAVSQKDPKMREAGEKFHLSYKIVKTECKLVRSILHAHGFHEAHPSSPDFNLIWTGCHLKPYMLRSLADFQKVNHFPRSYELTRKDRLFKNIQRMQQIKGFKNFDIVPMSYILPAEFQEFCSGFLKDKGPYIVKPIASSRGRGIFLCTHPDQVPLDEQLIASKYIPNPYLIDGFKFDIRFYVAVTSYDPLVIYLYEEGLVRFATVKYQGGTRYLRTHCMHLTNYSVNKKNQDFVQNDDADVEDYGNKWSLGALLRYLRSEGKDIAALMMRIEDVLVKAIVSVEMPVATACKMFQPTRGNCFELYGFDIILDDTLRPWLLEVNLSPSLACDSPLDFKIKCHMLSDLLTLTGFICQDPVTRPPGQNRPRTAGAGFPGAGPSFSHVRRPSPSRPSTASSSGRGTNTRPGSGTRRRPGMGNVGPSSGPTGLSAEEARMIRRVREEYQRRAGWMRIFPSKDSWDVYSGFLQSNSHNNLVLHQKLFPQAWTSSGDARASLPRNRYPLHSLSAPLLEMSSWSEADPQRRIGLVYKATQDRIPYYERKLGADPMKRRAKSAQPKLKSQPPQPFTGPQTKGLFRGNLIGTEESPPTSPPPEPAPQAPDPPAQETQSDPPKPESLPSPHDIEDAADHDDPPPRDPTVSSLVDRGGSMNRNQARQAFAAYLTRVQRRLTYSGDDAPSDGSQEEAEEAAQLELVLRFMRRAATSLQDFRVSIPSRRLPLARRRHILAGMLADFVRLYRRQTEAMIPLTIVAGGIPEAQFLDLLSRSSEAQLEALLTAYTKEHKSAGLFISSSSGGGASANPKSNGESTTDKTASQDSGIWEVSDDVPLSRSSIGVRPAATPTQRRPASAVFSTRSGAIRTPLPGRPPSPYLAYADDAAINAALQKLAVRQQARQYAAYRVSTVLGRDKAGQGAGAVKGRPNSAGSPLSVSVASSSSVGNPWTGNLNIGPTAQNLLAQFNQSRALLEQSRAKHDALLARSDPPGQRPAHDPQGHNPRPPTGPRPSSAAVHHRNVRNPQPSTNSESNLTRDV